MKYFAKSNIENLNINNEKLEFLINDEDIKIENSFIKNVNIKKNDNVNKLNKKKTCSRMSHFHSI
jgi:hypothetical protein